MVIVRHDDFQKTALDKLVVVGRYIRKLENRVEEETKKR